jgi:DNA-binding PadR family transcriptional regulator
MNSESTSHHEHGFGPRSAHGHAPAFAPGFVLGHGGRGRFGQPGFGGFGPRGFTGPGLQRKRRGDVRIAILSLLADKASNGYGLIKEIGERSGGTWMPSPGSVYPTLQQLVDEELIEGAGKGPRQEFQLTDAGRAYVAEHAEELTRVWEGASERADADAGLHESIGQLMGVVHQFRFAASAEQRAKAIEILDATRKSLYSVLAE